MTDDSQKKAFDKHVKMGGRADFIRMAGYGLKDLWRGSWRCLSRLLKRYHHCGGGVARRTDARHNDIALL